MKEITRNVPNYLKIIRYVLSGIFPGTTTEQRTHSENIFLNVLPAPLPPPPQETLKVKHLEKNLLI